MAEEHMVKDQKTGERRKPTAEENIEIICLRSGNDPKPYLEQYRNANPKKAQLDAYYKNLEKKFLNK